MLTPHLLSANVHLDTRLNDVVFTGKIVKSLLIDTNPRLKEVFAKTAGVPPKHVHITPLYREEGERVRCLYSHAVEDYRGHSGGGWRVEKVVLENGLYRFYTGFVEGDAPGTLRFEDVYNTLLNISGTHRFSEHVIKAELASISVVDVASLARSAVRELVEGSGRVRIVFASPTLLRDPLRTSKHKSLVPTPLNIFSTPVYILHHLSGKGLERGRVVKTLLALHRLLNEPHSYLKTVMRKWIVYEKHKNPIPALIGYVNLHLNETYFEQYSKISNIEEMLEKTLTITTALGTGTSRATGFGHVTIEPVRKT